MIVFAIPKVLAMCLFNPVLFIFNSVDVLTYGIRNVRIDNIGSLCVFKQIARAVIQTPFRFSSLRGVTL